MLAFFSLTQNTKKKKKWIIAIIFELYNYWLGLV